MNSYKVEITGSSAGNGLPSTLRAIVIEMQTDRTVARCDHFHRTETAARKCGERASRLVALRANERLAAEQAASGEDGR